MRVLITTGIYPPKIGGPAQYSKNLKKALIEEGIGVSVATFGLEDHLPTGFRHIWFMFKIIPKMLAADVVIAMDTFSVALPSVVLGNILGKRVYIRTGGDFLWEQYVERTKKKVLFKDFYNTDFGHLNKKEKIIFSLTRWTLRNSTKVVFSTNWQREIFVKAYGLYINKTSIIENYYGEKESDEHFVNKDFVASTRDLVWKNIDTLKTVFDDVEVKYPEIQLVTKNTSYEDFMNQMKKSYAVVLVSLGDISPNMILDAIRYNRPFICTKEVGIYNRIKDTGIFVDPLNPEEIKNAFLKLLNEEEYKAVKEKVVNFNFTHSWDEIAQEFLSEINHK